MNNAEFAARRFANKPNHIDLVIRQLKADGINDEDILTGLSMAAGFIKSKAVAA